MDAVDDFVKPAFFSCSAANVERTELIIYCEELEAASMSATSAAIAAVVFLVVCPVCAVTSIDDAEVTEDLESTT